MIHWSELSSSNIAVLSSALISIRIDGLSDLFPPCGLMMGDDSVVDLFRTGGLRTGDYSLLDLFHPGGLCTGDDLLSPNNP